MVPLLIASGLGLVLALTLLGLPADHRVWQRDWDALLNPVQHAQLGNLARRLRAERGLDDFNDRQARAAFEAGDPERARQLLALGYQALEEAAVGRRLLLRDFAGQLALWSRMVDAVAPLPPVSPRRFRLPRLRRLAALAVILHHAGLTAAERLRLRTWMIALGFVVVLRTRFHTGSSLDWRLVQASREDYWALSDETLETARALLASIAVMTQAERTRTDAA
jgi:hypothetical protein